MNDIFVSLYPSVIFTFEKLLIIFKKEIMAFFPIEFYTY